MLRADPYLQRPEYLFGTLPEVLMLYSRINHATAIILEKEIATRKRAILVLLFLSWYKEVD